MFTKKDTAIFNENDSEFAKLFDQYFDKLSDNGQVMLAKAVIRTARHPEVIAQVITAEVDR